MKKAFSTSMSAETRPARSKRAIAARENGREGGFERASRYGPEVLSEWSSWGGKTVLAKYGREHFIELRKRRKHYPKYTQPVEQPSPRVLAGRRNGQRGGIARAERHSPEQLREWARMGGIATRKQHEPEFFRKIRSMRRHYKRGYLARKTKERLKQQADQVIMRLTKNILNAVGDSDARRTRRY